MIRGVERAQTQGIAPKVVLTLTGVLLLALGVATPVAAEEPALAGRASPKAARMPWPDFRTLVTDWAQPSEPQHSVASVDALLAILEGQAEEVRAWKVALESVEPETCYAAARDRLKELFSWTLASGDYIRPLIEQQSSLDGALPYVRLWVEVAHARFPELHVEDETVAPGYRLDLKAALSLADCDDFEVNPGNDTDDHERAGLQRPTP